MFNCVSFLGLTNKDPAARQFFLYVKQNLEKLEKLDIYVFRFFFYNVDYLSSFKNKSYLEKGSVYFW